MWPGYTVGVEKSVPRSVELWTMSGGEPSSIKRFSACAAGVPALSRLYKFRTAVMFEIWVCGRAMGQNSDIKQR